MKGFEAFLEVLSFVAFVGLGITTLLIWRRRKDRPSFWTFLTFADLGLVVIAGRVFDAFEDSESWALDYAQTLRVAVVLLVPYLLFRVAHSFGKGGRFAHLVASVPTAIVVLWAIVVPRFPDEGEPRPTWYVVFIFAVLFQWVLCSLLVAVRFWRAGSGQPPVTRKRMRTMSLAATSLSVALVISGAAGGDENVGSEIAVQIFALGSSVAFFFAFAPPAWLRASWRRESEEDSRRAVIDLMGSITDEAVVDALLPHAATLIGAQGVAMFDTKGRLVGSFGGATEEWEERVSLDAEELERDAFQKLDFPFGCLVVKTTPYTVFFGRDEVELLGALGVMTNLALERVRASEMRLELSEANIRRQQALQINDNVVQGLAVAKYALDLGETDKATEAIEGTLKAARKIISDLLDEVSTDDVFGPTALTRDSAATGFVKKDI